MINRNVDHERFKYSHELYNYLELYSEYLNKHGYYNFADLLYFIQFVLLDYDSCELLYYSEEYNHFKNSLNHDKKRR